VGGSARCPFRRRAAGLLIFARPSNKARFDAGVNPIKSPVAS
jgi:hypothetical protein